MRMLLTATVLTLVVTTAAGQDALKVLPNSYSLQFENEWVRVVRVRYAPYAKLPAHTHTSLASAYVYLNDSGPVIFRHIDASYGAATRPATKAGGFRVFRGLDEIHEVENTSELPSEFLRIEFKTEPKDVRTLKGRFFRQPNPSGDNVEHAQFDNEQVRITRLVCAVGRSVHVAAGATEPALLIALNPARLRVPDASSVVLSLGQERWLPAAGVAVFENVGTEPAEFLRFDFKSPPLVSEGQRPTSPSITSRYRGTM